MQAPDVGGSIRLQEFSSNDISKGLLWRHSGGNEVQKTIEDANESSIEESYVNEPCTSKMTTYPHEKAQVTGQKTREVSADYVPDSVSDDSDTSEVLKTLFRKNGERSIHSPSHTNPTESEDVNYRFSDYESDEDDQEIEGKIYFVIYPEIFFRKN